jgi:hypothetical protein
MEAWGDTANDPGFSINQVSVYVFNLRKKIGENGPQIQSKKGKGYWYDAPQDSDQKQDVADVPPQPSPDTAPVSPVEPTAAEPEALPMPGEEKTLVDNTPPASEPERGFVSNVEYFPPAVLRADVEAAYDQICVKGFRKDAPATLITTISPETVVSRLATAGVDVTTNTIQTYVDKGWLPQRDGYGLTAADVAALVVMEKRGDTLSSNARRHILAYAREEREDIIQSDSGRVVPDGSDSVPDSEPRSSKESPGRIRRARRSYEIMRRANNRPSNFKGD